jgi:hypothetical protein
MPGTKQDRRAPPAVLVVSGADTPLGAALVAEARRLSLPVLACGADQAALAALADPGVVALTLDGAGAAQVRGIRAVAEDRFGGVHGVVHAAGHGATPATEAELGGRLAGVRALVEALPPETPHVLVVEESGRRGDPEAPLRAAAAAALAGWARSRSPAPRVAWVPAGADPAAWAGPLLRAVRPVGLRGRVADQARRLVRRRG